MTDRDTSLDNLLFLDGERFVVDADGKCWVTFEVKQCRATPVWPHGAKYWLTLHDEDGQRLLGFDNAHAIHKGSGPRAPTRIAYDHKHSGEQIQFYGYEDAVTFLTNFWTEVEMILQNRSKS